MTSRDRECHAIGADGSSWRCQICRRRYKSTASATNGLVSLSAAAAEKSSTVPALMRASRIPGLLFSFDRAPGSKYSGPKTGEQMSPGQCRAARAWLGWSRSNPLTSIGEIMSNVRPSPENHLCRDARNGSAWAAGLLRRLPLQAKLYSRRRDHRCRRCRTVLVEGAEEAWHIAQG